MTAEFSGKVIKINGITPVKDVSFLKRFFLFFLCALMLCLPVRADSGQPLVALTFDDGPSGRFTRRLLEGLETRHAPATFLLCGYRIADYPALTKQILDAGHEIGLHGYSHTSMKEMPRQQIQKELADTLALLPQNCPIQFLRPPGGQCTGATRAAARQMGFWLLNWSVDPRDWNTEDAALIARRVISQTRDGDVILLHDMSDSSVDAALAIVDALQAKGFRFVTVSQLAQAKGVHPLPGQLYCRFD